MEFDKSKILTVVTADQAKIGQKGWFAILPEYIQEDMSGGQEPSVLSNIDLDSPSPFTRESGYAWPLFYPAPELTYRPFTNDELNDIVGKVVTSKLTGDNRMVSERDSLNLVHIGCSQYTAEDLLEWYTLDGHPCGVREEA